MTTKIPKLFTPLKLRSVELRNRIVVSPMCQFSSEDGFYNDWHLVHLGSKAVGGAGLVMTEATAVEPEGRISSADAGIWKDEHIEFLQRITKFLKQQGAAAGIQLAHAGRKGSVSVPWKSGEHLKTGTEEGGWETKAPSAIKFGEHHLSKLPQELTVPEIRSIVTKFGAAAKRAITAGFDLIELHAGNGYLTHQFLSPLSNHRIDEYGGSLENRMRFLIEMVQEVRASIPETTPLLVRLSVTDWHESGFKLEDAVETSKVLRDHGVDLIEATSGFVIGNYQDIKFAPGFHVPFSAKIKSEVGEIAVGASGVIVDGEQANTYIEEGKVDLVFIAREFLRDPQFPFHAAQKLHLENPQSVLPVQYSHWLKDRH